jgi:hypothetical protein
MKYILSATVGFAWIYAGIIAAAAYRLSAGEKAINNRSSTSDSRVHSKSAELTVQCARAAFHTAVFVNDRGFAVPHLEYLLRAYLDTAPASCAFFLIISKC